MSCLKLVVTVVVVSVCVTPTLSQQSVCFRPPETGLCRAFLPSYYYNPQAGQCDCFVFGGCNPGGNQFVSLESCMQTCGVSPSSQTVTSECRRLFGGRSGSSDAGISQNSIQQQQQQGTGGGGGVVSTRRRPDGCFASPETGTCRAFIPAYYFNPQTGSCDCFAFGGCRPNPNNFASVRECMDTCLVEPSAQFLSNECIRLFGNQTTSQQQHQQPSTTGQQQQQGQGQGQVGSQIDPDFIRQNQGNQNFGNQNLGPVVAPTSPPFIAPSPTTSSSVPRTEDVREPPRGSVTRLIPVSAVIFTPSGTGTGQLAIGQPVRITG